MRSSSRSPATATRGLGWRGRAAWLSGLSLCLLALGAGPAWAGQVRTEIKSWAWLEPGGRVQMRATVTNRGDEPALDLVAVLLHPELTQASTPLIGLAPGQSTELSLSLAGADAAPGRHALVFRLNLRDQNQSPFSALGYAYYLVEAEPPRPLTLGADPVSLSGQGRLGLSLHNRQETALEVTLRVFAPGELLVSPALSELTLEPGQGRELGLELKNLAGQPGASYPLFILTSCQYQGLLCQQVEEIAVNLAPPPNPFREHLAWWLGALAALLLWIAARQWWPGRRP